MGSLTAPLARAAIAAPRRDTRTLPAARRCVAVRRPRVNRGAGVAFRLTRLEQSRETTGAWRGTSRADSRVMLPSPTAPLGPDDDVLIIDLDDEDILDDDDVPVSVLDPEKAHDDAC